MRTGRPVGAGMRNIMCPVMTVQRKKTCEIQKRIEKAREKMY